ncbi:MAG: DUF721 domain-containing protein [Thermodesulfobacteriota bacterium]
MKKAGSILSEVIRDHPLEKLKTLGQLRSAWTDAVGETVSAHAQPVDLREGTLVVQVDTSVWMQQLSFLKPQMVAKLKSYEVRDVRFVLGRSSRVIPAAGFHKRGWTKIPLEARDEALIGMCEDALADPKLKKRIGRLLQTALSRRRAP